MPRPPDDEDVQLWTQDGVCLAARQVLPSQLRGTLVACHPHPLFGGTMNNKVVHTLYKVFRDQGFGAIRFNFRGTGASGGEHGQGYSEALDVGAAAEALDEAASSRPLANDATEPLPRVLGGFSFGSQVGLRYAADDPTFTHRIGIGLPIGKEGYDFDFLLAGDLRPLYLVVGEDDPFCPLPLLRQLVVSLRERGVTVDAKVVPQANHFFDRLGHVLRQEFDAIACAIVGHKSPPRRYPVESL